MPHPSVTYFTRYAQGHGFVKSDTTPYMENQLDVFEAQCFQLLSLLGLKDKVTRDAEQCFYP